MIRLLFLTLISCSAALSTFAQTDAWAGRWNGALDLPGMKLDMSIELTQANGAWTGTLDIPMQRVQDMALGDLHLTADSIHFRLPEVPGNASYAGARNGGVIEGTFRQAGNALPLTFTKESEQDRQALAAKVDSIRVLIDSFRNGADVPGIGVGIIYKGETLLSDGFGYRNVEQRLPVTQNTIFAIGSSSKAFTTMGLGLLVEEGKLDWDEPIRKYLPDFRLKDDFATAEMNAIDLTSHRSGLPRHDLLWYFTDLSRQELYNRLRYLEPSASFRTKWQYQNLMYLTAGVLIEELSGKPWEDFTRERIFEPLGMTSAGFKITDLQAAPDHATGYGTKDDSTFVLPYHALDAIGPAGSINASAEDMLKWVRLHLGGGKVDGRTIISEANLQKMHTPQMILEGAGGIPGQSHRSYGLGWFIHDHKGDYVVEHGGNIDGFSALVFLMPEEDLGMVFLTNRNGTPLGYILAYTIADMLLEDRDRDDYFSIAFGKKDEEEKEEEEPKKEERRVTGTHAQHQLADYTGTYTHPGYGDLLIEQRSNRLHARYYRLNTALEHWHYETFKGRNDTLDLDLLLTFRTDANGNVNGLEVPIEQALDPVLFTKKPNERLRDTAFLSTLTGQYKLGEMVATVALSGRELTVEVPGQPIYTLEPYQGTEFQLKSISGFSIEFILENGRPTAATFHQPNGSFRAERVRAEGEAEATPVPKTSGKGKKKKE